MVKLTGYNVAIIVFVCLGGFTYGYAFAAFATSIGQPGFYLDMKLDPSSTYTANIIGAVSALFAAGAAFGAISQGWTADWLGRKGALALAAGLSMVGGALTAGSVNVPMLVVMRFIQGWGLGQLIALVPLYITEVAPPHRRGALAGLTACSFAVGYVISAWVGYGAFFSPNLKLQWRLPLALACLAPLLILCGVWFLPESPRYLCWVGKIDDAWPILQKLHHDATDPTEAAAHAEFIQISKQVEFDKTMKAGYLEMFKKPSWRRRSILVLFLMFATQSAGILGITNFIVLITQSLGMTGSMPLLMYAVYTVVATMFNFVGSFFMDKIGRRRMMLIGFPTTAICLLAEALLQRRYIGTDEKAGLGAALFWIFMYAVCYGMFLDPPQFVWCAEVFPTVIRAKGIGLTFFSYFVGAITYTTPGALAFKNIGWRYYLVWFSCNIVSTIIIYFFVQETSNLTLEEIGELFGDKVVVHITKDGTGIVEETSTQGGTDDDKSAGHASIDAVVEKTDGDKSYTLSSA